MGYIIIFKKFALLSHLFLYVAALTAAAESVGKTAALRARLALPPVLYDSSDEVSNFDAFSNIFRRQIYSCTGMIVRCISSVDQILAMLGCYNLSPDRC